MKIAILTSGGDAPGMNATIRAIIRAGIKENYEFVGVRDGFQGLLDNDFIPLDPKRLSGLLSLGGTFLGTARVPNFHQDELQMQAVDNLNKNNIDYLITIGGDGTLKGTIALAKRGVNCLSIPATIDNDMPGTEKAIGFATALNTIVDAVDKIRDTSQSHRRCSIIEVMGRHRGDLALHAGICAGAEIVVTPENKLSKEYIIGKMRDYYQTDRRHAIIIVTENQFDVHKLAQDITKESLFPARATILGYLQRGGKPVPEDRILASLFGNQAIKLIKSNRMNCLIGIKNSKLICSSYNKKIDYIPENDEIIELQTLA